MRYPGALSRHCLGVLMAISSGMVLINAVADNQPPGEPETQSTFYTYHDDWAIVSAPPPPGPYQSVNVDPRIPGQEDVITPFVSGFNAPAERGEQLPGEFTGAPPAAGIPSPGMPGAYPGQGSFEQRSPPGYYRPREYTQNRPAPVQNYQGGYGYPRSGGSRYGYPPSPWDNPPAAPAEDEVPPPPVYNRMAAPPPPGYRSRPAPDQIYRRGTGTQ